MSDSKNPWHAYWTSKDNEDCRRSNKSWHGIVSMHGMDLVPHNINLWESDLNAATRELDPFEDIPGCIAKVHEEAEAGCPVAGRMVRAMTLISFNGGIVR